MRFFITTFILNVFFLLHLSAQKEATNWILSPNSLLNFNPLPPTFNYTPALPFITWESSASISDSNGNLLFYTDGDTVRGSNGSVLPNGDDVSFVQSVHLQSTTQGALFVKKPNSSNLYYLFSLGFYQDKYDQGVFSYSIVDKNLNGGVGSVVSRYNMLCLDTLAEKMTATKHCNGRDFWIVVVKCLATKLKDGLPVEYLTEFQSYLLTENGVQASPVKSVLKTRCGRFGQMKFNNKGDELAFARADYLTLLDFDKSSGKISLKSERKLPLRNGYGVEYSPNDSLIYINQLQYHIASNTITSLNNPNYLAQLQRGLDNKIYSIRVTDGGGGFSNSTIVFPWTQYNWADAYFIGIPDNTYNLVAIENPNLIGNSCSYTPNYLVTNIPTPSWSVALPNFPSFYFNHPISEFVYSGTCAGETFQFSLANSNLVPDSVHWIFHDTGYEVTSISSSYIFPGSGDWQVTCIVYINGIATSSTQCVNVCGINNVSLPAKIDLCDIPTPFELNALNTCSSVYLWSTGDTTASIKIENEGIYTLQTTNSCGVYDYTVEVFKGDNCTVLAEIPNIITVNNDQT
ncbi:hypothetical protein, partial [Fluviicola sp.]|uniref:hypothetical protein n=1 Tax=Fluviicola sp. TaxID=1917219 RepID=UPI0026181E27